MSGDALYCQKAVCRQIVQAGGAYLFAVKANQPDLLDDVTLLFHDPPPDEHFATASTVGKHGGRLEVRRLRASAALAAYLRVAGWAAAGLVLEIETTVRWPSHPAQPIRHEVRDFLTSLPAHTRPAEALRATRRHWQIENRLHWPRDVTLGEDACQVRSGHAPPGARGHPQHRARPAASAPRAQPRRRAPCQRLGRSCGRPWPARPQTLNDPGNK